MVGDSATVGTVNRSSGEFKSVDETSAFNLQQGAMMHWVGNGSDEEITYNDWENGRVVARAVHPTTGARRTIDGAIATVSPDRHTGMGLDFARMAHCRPVVGYANNIDSAQIDPFPEDYGLFLLDFYSGRFRLVISIAEVIRASDYQMSEGGHRMVQSYRLQHRRLTPDVLLPHQTAWTAKSPDFGLEHQPRRQ